MKIGSTAIDDTFAEAFRMRYTRLLVTARDSCWAEIAAREVTGYGSSIIACDAEAGIERSLAGSETPDGRPGLALLFFGFSTDALAGAVRNRIGQCVLTCPTTAVYADHSIGDGDGGTAESFPLGQHLRYFGDGFQGSKVIDGRRYWRIPVMDGEFLVEALALSAKGVAGGNFLIQGRSQDAALDAAARAADAVASLPDVITPFPGGVARSGSKVGSRYRDLRASTNDAFCPTLRSRVASSLHPEANAVYEIIINGTGEEPVATAMRAGVLAACSRGDDGGPDGGVVAISAGNYGGKLGKFHFHLHDVMR